MLAHTAALHDIDEILDEDGTVRKAARTQLGVEQPCSQLLACAANQFVANLKRTDARPAARQRWGCAMARCGDSATSP
jgi:hypothetical protein